MEISIGEYVRTKRGEICKVLGIRPEIRTEKRVFGHLAYYLDNRKGCLTPAYIVKHSKDIIDLIEEDDYVNGDEVVEIDYTEDEKGNYINVLGIMEIDDDYAYPIELRNLNIKTIVTKEQIKQIEYRIGD